MKHVYACLSARKDLESSLRKDVEGSFHNCGGPVRLVLTCLNAGNV